MDRKVLSGLLFVLALLGIPAVLATTRAQKTAAEQDARKSLTIRRVRHFGRTMGRT